MSKRKTHRILIPIALIAFASLFFLSLFSLFALRSKHAPQKETTPPETTEPRFAGAPVVIIDAGHGGEDGGAIGTNGVCEKDLNLSVALELEQMLSSAGIRTRLTRDTDTLLYDRASDYHGHKKAQDAAARVAIAREYEDAVFISIHMNSFSQSKYKGLQVYYSENSPRSAALAEYVQSAVAKSLQPQNTRKIKPSAGSIFVLDNVGHPAILIECGFLTNPEECELLCTQEYRSRLCATLYFAVIEYLENTELTP